MARCAYNPARPERTSERFNRPNQLFSVFLTTGTCPQIPKTENLTEVTAIHFAALPCLLHKGGVRQITIGKWLTHVLQCFSTQFARTDEQQGAACMMHSNAASHRQSLLTKAIL
ncbi:hypothetical protein SAMN04488515_1166 [Cognatiyoonia koreensis]|uniref:Uncharacterized protein n=1 Tax=Cognatiyoonia koreensis TaxID=364200 RepID=A0A1I0PDL3_9RHOB|nr:hypothetical protein SAMN04488515_1166 [Cognatiyoonia koreensis]